MIRDTFPAVWYSNLAKNSDIYFLERDFTQMIWRRELLPAFGALTQLNNSLPISPEAFLSDAKSYVDCET